MRKLSFVASAVVLAVLAGCSSTDPAPSNRSSADPIGTTASPIIGGIDSTSDQDSVILLAIRVNGQLSGTCSGTLVAPNLVLTARHCVSDTDEGAVCTSSGQALQQGQVHSDRAPTDLYVYTGVDGIQSADQVSQAAARGKTIMHEASTTICDSDISFLILDTSLPGVIAPIRLTSPAREGEKLTAVGWGLVDSGQLPSTRQQRANIEVQAVGPVTLDTSSNIGLGASEFLVGESICSGDSGGPTFSTKGALVGVVSRGGGGPQSTTNQATNCTGSNVINFYTQLSQKQAFVNSAFAAAGATPRLEGDPPGAAVGDACKQDLDCSSNACISQKCERRCDDGTKCADTEVCKTVDTKMVCQPAPKMTPVATAAPADTAPPVTAAAPPATTTTTTTSGCSASPTSTDPSRSGLGVGLFLAAAVIASRRRRPRRDAARRSRIP